MKNLTFTLSTVVVLIFGCTKSQNTTNLQSTSSSTTTISNPNLVFKIHFDSTLARLDNFGNATPIPAGHAAQTPNFNHISAHYIEFTKDSSTQLGAGEIAYRGIETLAGGSNAVDFNNAILTEDGSTLYTKPLSTVAAETYKWLRVSLTYQNYNIIFKNSGNLFTGTLASFVGFNTYISNYTINTQNVVINNNKLQGYWGFETSVLGNYYVSEGQSPGTTVPNPISATSPIPNGSCVVTGSFPTPLTITGSESEDIIVHINLSTNNSFEWKDLNSDGFFEPSDGINPGDTVVDMGIRGLFPTFE